MSEPNCYERLGVSEDASFEEIQEAKKRLSKQYSGDRKVVESIDAAYDAIIMDRLRMRQEGKIKVPEGIRFPERNFESPANFANVSPKNSPQWLQNLIDTPSREDILWPTGVFLLLIGLAIFSQEDSILASLLAFGFGANVYFLNRKEQRLGRSMLISLLALMLGIGIGGALAGALDFQNGLIAWTALDFTAVFIFFVFWLASSFLR